MLNDEERLKQKEKRKKILIIIAVIIVGIFVILGITILILSAIKNSLNDKNKKELEDSLYRSYNFVEPDYDLNIFEDEYYMNQCDRSIWVNDSGARTVISDNNYNNYSAEIKFMSNVINYIISGDYVEYNGIFTDDYLASAGDDLREIFTMQQLYNIELEIIDYTQSANMSYSVVKVSYMIRNNNGTFRNDLPEGAIRPVIYKLTTTMTQDNTVEIKATDMMPYSLYSSGLYD